jgi:hypothetical protein
MSLKWRNDKMKSKEIVEILHSENPERWISLVEKGVYTPEELKELISTYKQVPNRGSLLFSIIHMSKLYPQYRDQVPEELLIKFYTIIRKGSLKQ